MLDTPIRFRAANSSHQSSSDSAESSFLRSNTYRDLPEDFNIDRRRAKFDFDPLDAEQQPTGRSAYRRKRSVRLRLGARLPRSGFGRAIAALVLLGGCSAVAFGLWRTRGAVLTDPRFFIPSSQAIEISGNSHLTRAQLLSVFGEDVDRNIFNVPLEQRRAELEALPWVEHATVMRLMPNQLRVAITERTPVAYVRQGSEIGLVDAHGVLMEIAPEDADPAKTYHLPIVTGISTADPASTRAARMKLFSRFTAELDSNSKSHTDKITDNLSEVDLSDPEDIKALMTGTGILVHFGDRDFLPRYQRYIQNLPDWKVRYPKLASTDMRYGNQIVLQMEPGTAVPAASDTIPPPVPHAAKQQAKAGVKPAIPASKLVHAAKLRTGKPSLKSVAGHKPHSKPEIKAYPKVVAR